MPAALATYDVVLALHIMAVLAAFGLPLAYPVLVPYMRRTHPRAMPALHDTQSTLTKRIVAPGTVGVLVFGAYLATDADLWGEAWVGAGLAIVLIIAGVGGAYMGPRFVRLAEVATRDVASAPAEGDVVWSSDYETLYTQVMTAERILGALVLVAVFLMAAKPF